jgi:hypothetical protein
MPLERSMRAYEKTDMELPLIFDVRPKPNRLRVRRNKKTTKERRLLLNFDTDLQQDRRYLKTFARLFMKKINILEARWPLPDDARSRHRYRL